MTSGNSQPSREDVLYAFAVELTPGRDTLERYLRDYPEYTDGLIDLSYELSREVREDEMPLSVEQQAMIDSAWQQHVEAAPKEVIDPFANLTVTAQRDLARQLSVPRQVITAFREHRVEPNSVPLPFLKRMAVVLNITAEGLRDFLGQSLDAELMRSYKADSRPESPTKVDFEQLLIDANVPPDKRKLLMEGEF